MSAEPTRHLHLVDSDTGEVVESRELADLQDRLEKALGDLKNAERDLRGKRSVIARMEADRVRERLEHPQRDLIRGILKYWHQMCRPKDYGGRRQIVSDSPDRFDAVAALVEMERIVRDETAKGKRRREWVYQREHFVAAVQGAAFDPFTPKHKNGKPNPQNNALQVFGSVDKFDVFIEKCPYEVVPILPARPAPGEAVDTDRDASNLSGEGSKPAPASGAHRSEVKHGQVGRIMGATGRCLATPQQGGGLHVQWRVAARLAGEPGA